MVGGIAEHLFLISNQTICIHPPWLVPGTIQRPQAHPGKRRQRLGGWQCVLQGRVVFHNRFESVVVIGPDLKLRT